MLKTRPGPNGKTSRTSEKAEFVASSSLLEQSQGLVGERSVNEPEAWNSDIQVDALENLEASESAEVASMLLASITAHLSPGDYIRPQMRQMPHASQDNTCLSPPGHQTNNKGQVSLWPD